MKKELLQIAFCLLIYSTGFAQNQQTIDSLKHELTIAKKDANKVNLLNELSEQYVWSSYPDTAVLYSQQALNLAEGINYDQGIISAQGNMGLALTTLGNYPLALDFGFKALARAQKNHDIISIYNLHVLMVVCYRDQGDYKNALFYNREALRIGEQFHFKDIEIFIGGAATIFAKSSEPDSAIIYANRAYYLSKTWNNSLLYSLGTAYSKKGNYDSAMFYYQASLAAAVKNRTGKDVIDIYNGIALVQKSKGNIDSAAWYAKKVLYEKTGELYPPGLLTAATILTDIYQLQNKADSTLKYLRVATRLKDSLFGREKTMAIQNLEFKEKEKQQETEASKLKYQNRLRIYILLGGLLALLLIASILLRSNRHKQNAKTKIEKAFTELKSAQTQLVQREKMASLGELTAGIAHEIQNPLNFVNNFSEVNKELVDELQQELKAGKIDDAITISNDIRDNEEKINHHGKRADAIVKGMLQHSRLTSGLKEPTDINALADEYLRLAYHGLRAKDNSFSASIKTDFDKSIGNINIIPQDIGRVLLNLYNNAFYAVNEKKKITTGNYEPTVTLSTRHSSSHLGGQGVEIKVIDNGAGIPQNIVDKIFQPFFTTKPTGQGTGLGLSLSYDIIKAHGGDLRVDSKEGEGIPDSNRDGQAGTSFIIELPMTTA